MNTGIIRSISSFFSTAKSTESDMTTLQIGDAAPAFEGSNERGETVRLSDYAGKRLILFFYPADNTPGCTAAACSLRDAYADLAAQGFEMLGVSPDSVKKHEGFIQKYQFPFSLLADTDQTVMKAYGVWGLKKFMGREFDGVHRTTFVIGATGNIEHIFTKVDTKNHAEQILELVEKA
jgi:thioredoxin-dependent peroxiredoxin